MPSESTYSPAGLYLLFSERISTGTPHQLIPVFWLPVITLKRIMSEGADHRPDIIADLMSAALCST
ncbi:MAG: hypothetical protein BWY89_02023 [Bacteroidetes bacterium ADurb.BinA012]|nr:MAG: hypothetical protein BWY89_02023 [Bacteroidetes bacterium ADurb.BinA012]